MGLARRVACLRYGLIAPVLPLNWCNDPIINFLDDLSFEIPIDSMSPADATLKDSGDSVRYRVVPHPPRTALTR